MNRLQIGLTAASMLVAPAAMANGVTWAVNEGQGGATKGVWHLKMRGDKVSGSADMTTPTGQRVFYHLQGTRQGKDISLQRANPSDSRHCIYRGRIDDEGRAVGVSMCGATQLPWSGTRR